MIDIAKLEIRIHSLEAATADKRLNRLAKTGGRTERATDGLSRSFKRLAGSIALTATATAALRKLVDVTRTFGSLHAALKTATGSVENAVIAFEALQDFAKNTPYDIEQVTLAFIRLVNLGLEPSERALYAYGNIASATPNKSLLDFIEAVADGIQGNNERLKEFSIGAKKQGDTIAYTFQNVTTVVKNNAAAIEEYMMGLGENQFGGAMSDQMETLGGALSNLGDEWNTLFLNISDEGIGGLIEDSVRLAIASLEDLNEYISSGELTANITQLGRRWSFVKDDAINAFNLISAEFAVATENWKVSGNEATDRIAEGLNSLPETFRAVIQIFATEFAYLVDSAGSAAKSFVRAFEIEFDALGAYASAIAEEIGKAFTIGEDADFASAVARVTAEAEAAHHARRVSQDREIAGFDSARMDGINAALDGREEAIDLTKDENAKLAKQLELQRLINAEKDKGTTDRLAQFGLGAVSGTGGGPAKESVAERRARKAEEREAARRQREFEALVMSLRTEEEAIEQSYARRQQIILTNTEEGSAKRQELMQRLNEQYAVSILGYDPAEPDTFEEELEAINAFFERRKELILTNAQLTEEERTELELQLTRDRKEALADLEAARIDIILSSGKKIAQGLTSIAKDTAGEQSGIYRAMFAASKAFAIAESIISIQTAIAKASKSLPYPANLKAMASVVSATAGLVSTIMGTNYSGAHDKGGTIPAGKYGLVGEYGPELVSGPAKVTGRGDTAKMIEKLMTAIEGLQNRQEAQQNNLRIINVTPESAEEYMGSDAGEQVVMNWVTRNQSTIQRLAIG
jgi:hypothetical protein